MLPADRLRSHHKLGQACEAARQLRLASGGTCTPGRDIQQLIALGGLARGFGVDLIRVSQHLSRTTIECVSMWK
jgi:hypothetical protein